MFLKFGSIFLSTSYDGLINSDTVVESKNKITSHKVRNC